MVGDLENIDVLNAGNEVALRLAFDVASQQDRFRSEKNAKDDRAVVFGRTLERVRRKERAGHDPAEVPAIAIADKMNRRLLDRGGLQRPLRAIAIKLPGRDPKLMHFDTTDDIGKA